MSSPKPDDVVLKIGKKIGVPMQKSDISISHQIPSRKQFNDEGNPIPPAIIVIFVKRQTRENLYRARKNLKSISTADLGYSVANKIYINESLTEKNKELLKLCLKCKQDHSYKFLWTNAGRIFLKENMSSPVIPVNGTDDIPKTREITTIDSHCDRCPGRVSSPDSCNDGSYTLLPCLNISSSVTNIAHLTNLDIDLHMPSE